MCEGSLVVFAAEISFMCSSLLRVRCGKGGGVSLVVLAGGGHLCVVPCEVQRVI